MARAPLRAAMPCAASRAMSAWRAVSLKSLRDSGKVLGQPYYLAAQQGQDERELGADHAGADDRGHVARVAPPHRTNRRW